MDKSKTIKPLVMGIFSADLGIAALSASFAFMMTELFFLLSKGQISDADGLTALAISASSQAIIGSSISVCCAIPAFILTPLTLSASKESKEESNMAKIGHHLSIAGFICAASAFINIIVMIALCVAVQ